MGLLGLLLLSAAPGCVYRRYSCQEGLTHRILPPPDVDLREELASPEQTTPEAGGAPQARLELLDSPAGPDSNEAKMTAPAQASGDVCEPSQLLTLVLTLPEAIETAFRQQPRLRVYQESEIGRAHV